jgi:hypothetical protein
MVTGSDPGDLSSMEDPAALDAIRTAAEGPIGSKAAPMRGIDRGLGK